MHMKEEASQGSSPSFRRCTLWPCVVRDDDIEVGLIFTEVAADPVQEPDRSHRLMIIKRNLH